MPRRHPHPVAMAPWASPPGGAAALAALTGLGPFPVDMIGGGERMGKYHAAVHRPASLCRRPGRAAARGRARRGPAAPVAARGPPQPGRHDGLAVAHGARDHRGHRPLPGRDHAATAHRIGAVVDHPAALVRPPDRAGPAHLAALCGRSGRWPACPRARHPRGPGHQCCSGLAPPPLWWASPGSRSAGSPRRGHPALAAVTVLACSILAAIPSGHPPAKGTSRARAALPAWQPHASG